MNIIQNNLLETFNNKLFINYEIIFDTSSFSYHEIIDFMQKNRAKNIIFKNFLPCSNFIIGSNHANDLGIVLNLSKVE